MWLSKQASRQARFRLRIARWPSGVFEEAGAIWIQRVMDTFDKVIWINPTPHDTWEYSSSVALTKKLVDEQMFPLTIRGIEDGMNKLSK